MVLDNPFIEIRRNPAWRLASPAAIGSLSAATLFAVPEQYLWKLPVAEFPALRSVPNKLYLAVLAFVCGYAATSTADWIRKRILKVLLGYQGWVFNMRSKKTKAWALMLKAAKGPKPHKTFQFQPYLPNWPLPNLDVTLDRWLRVSRELVTEDEFIYTRQAVEEFRKNEGPKLQAFLQEKASKSLNWLHDYWLIGAYLSSRQPLALYSNYMVTNKLPVTRSENGLARAANFIHSALKFKDLIENETLAIAEIQNLVPLCMDGFRAIFSGIRLPGEFVDEIKFFPKSTHLVVLRKGQYFKLEVYKENDNKDRVPLSPYEFKVQLEKIKEAADESEEILPVAVLTAQRRDLWATQRQKLALNNVDVLKAVEEAIFLVSLEDKQPKDTTETTLSLLRGEVDNLWFDKSFTYVAFGNGSCGCNVEHSNIDAMVFSYMIEYWFLDERYDAQGDIPKSTISSCLQTPQRLNWNLKYLKDEILAAKEEYISLKDDFDCYHYCAPYGKRLIKPFGVSPDGFLQMALQLSFYRMHNVITRTYEPATSRFFVLGRTETINVISPSSKQWVMAMQDPMAAREDKIRLLREAISYQTAYKLDATVGRACDRHLVGLLCAARELGMDYPKIFADQAWQQPYRLSTSQTPTKVAEFGLDLDVDTIAGSFGPGCQDGYGISYSVMTEDNINFSITGWKSCAETSCIKFAETLHQVLLEMKEVMSK